MDQLPYELLRMIIEYVLASTEPPFCLQHCVRTRLKSRGKRAISTEERPLSLQKLLHEEWTVDHRFTRPTLHNWPWRWRYISQSQIRHLQDWKFVTRTCKRFSLLGKPLFFQMKTFAMMPRDGKNWHNTPVFGGNDNRIALQYIESVIFMESRLDCQPLLLMPQRLKGFSRLRRVDHTFGFSRKITRDFIDRVVQLKYVRRKAPTEVLEPFRVLGVKVDELDMGIIETWYRHNDNVKDVIHYPCISHLTWWTSQAKKSLNRKKRRQPTAGQPKRGRKIVLHHNTSDFRFISRVHRNFHLALFSIQSTR